MVMWHSDRLTGEMISIMGRGMLEIEVLSLRCRVSFECLVNSIIRFSIAGTRN